MAHGVGKVMQSLQWALASGPDDGDPDFKDRREGMTRAAERSDAQELLNWANLMFTDDHRDEFENLKAFEADEPGKLIRLAREFLKLPVEPEA